MTESRVRGQDPPAMRMTARSPSESEDEAEDKYIAPKIERTGSEDAPANETVVQSDPEVTPEEEKEENSEVGGDGSGVSSKASREALNALQSKPPAPEEDEEEEESEEESEDEGEDSDYDSEEDDEDGTAKKTKRVSYSRDLLKPTKEGNLIQSGVDVHAASQSKAHVPGYVNKQLKATGYGDKLKKGGAVPRDIVPQPDDPNAKLGDMYKSVKLKQGKEKTGENSSNLNPGNDTKAPAYASVALKKAKKPEEKMLKGETSPATLPAVKLNKAAPIVKEENRSSFPDVKLNKTVPIARDDASHFELPSEFSQAKQKLKRRTERHWYESELPEAKPSKKWFFQSGEWNDRSTPKPTTSKKSEGSWFFGGSSRESKKPPQLTPTGQTEEAGASLYRGHFTRVTTGKDLAKVQHFNELSASEAKSKKSPMKGKVSRQYHEDLQRRRKGLPPIRRRSSLLWRLFVWCCLFPLALYCGNIMFPEQVDAAWKHVQPQIEPILNQLEPQIAYVMEQVEPHVSIVMEHVQPHVLAVAEQVEPHFIAALDRVCTSIGDYEIPEDKKWAEAIHGASATICDSMRVKFGVAAEGESEEEEIESSSPDSHERVATPSKKARSKGKEKAEKQEAVTSNNGDKDECECDPKSKGPKWVKRLIPVGKKDKSVKCCEKKKQSAKEEKEL